VFPRASTVALRFGEGLEGAALLPITRHWLRSTGSWKGRARLGLRIPSPARIRATTTELVAKRDTHWNLGGNRGAGQRAGNGPDVLTVLSARGLVRG